jgi:peptidoglycan hydrolase-like protein with peptidoglycan-binding domain
MQLNASAITGPLALGSRGPDVRTLQAALNRAMPSLNLQVDGAFGMKTDAAVRTFQQSKTLKRDGIVGPRTAAALGLRYTAAAPLPGPSPQPPQRPRLPHETPVVPGPAGESAIAQLVEAVIQGLSEIHSGVLRIVHALEDLPDVVLNEIRSLLSGPFQAAVGILRGCVQVARANVAAAASIIGAAIRSAFQKMINALQSILSVLSRLPDLLGLSGVAEKIRQIIVKIQRAVEAIIDTIIRTLGGVGRTVSEAIPVILSALREVAAAAA